MEHSKTPELGRTRGRKRVGVVVRQEVGEPSSAEMSEAQIQAAAV